MARLVAMCAVLAVVVMVTVTAQPLAAARLPARVSAAEMNCDMAKLIDCKPAMTNGTTPLGSCCWNLKATDESCFCQYQKDPAYLQYLNNPSVLKTFASCGVALPTCP